MPRTDFHYRAFISYSHRDAKWAKWLHRTLERYVVPIEAFAENCKPGEEEKAKYRQRLTPVFRDRDELSASGSLGDTIRQALESSENLIVLCSPNSAASPYVNAEIETFRNLHPGNTKRIYALIIAGEPPGCFPPALIAGGAEPIAADAREVGDGKGDAKLKLIAGILGVGFDRLKQREAKRQRNRLVAMVAAVSAVAVMTSGLALWALRAEDKATEQKELAEKQRELAEISAAESKAVLGFFEAKVIVAARPEGQDGGLGIDTTIRAAIDAAEPQIGQAFADQPLVEASIRHTLGNSYVYLGKVYKAIPQQERAFELRQKALGNGHPDTLSTMNALANSYRDVGRHKEALALLTEVLESRVETLGPEHPDTLSSMSNLANLHQAAGREKTALALHEKTLEKRRLVLGDDHPDTLGSMNNLAISYGEIGRHDEALALCEEVMQQFKNKKGPLHPDTLKSMNNMAQALQDAGHAKEALALHQETLEKRKKVLGPGHPDTLSSMNNLAISHRELGHHTESLSLREEALEKRREILGEDHPDTLRAMGGLALSYQDAGRLDEAETLFRQYITVRGKRSAQDWRFFFVQSALGRILAGQKKYSEAESLLLASHEGLEITGSSLSESEAKRLKSVRESLAELYRDWGKPEKAAEWKNKLDELGKSEGNGKDSTK